MVQTLGQALGFGLRASLLKPSPYIPNLAIMKKKMETTIIH